MTRFLFRRLLILPLILLVAHAGGFVYAVLAGRLVQASGPFGGRLDPNPPSVWSLYSQTLNAIRQGDLGGAILPGKLILTTDTGDILVTGAH
jgi:hypothetical protein